MAFVYFPVQTLQLLTAHTRGNGQAEWLVYMGLFVTHPSQYQSGRTLTNHVEQSKQTLQLSQTAGLQLPYKMATSGLFNEENSVCSHCLF